MTRAQITAVWTLHNEATEALKRLAATGYAGTSERAAYLAAERRFYDAWRALDLLVDDEVAGARITGHGVIRRSVVRESSEAPQLPRRRPHYAELSASGNYPEESDG